MRYYTAHLAVRSVLFIRKNEYAVGTYYADKIECSDRNIYRVGRK